MIGLYALLGGLGLLVLALGYMIGRAESDAYYQPIIDQQQDTIDALLPPHVTVID